MSYDILLFPRHPGQSWDEALDAANQVPQSAGAALVPVWQRLEARLRQVLPPSVEGGPADDPGEGTVGELAVPETGLQVELYAGQAAVAFPYWDHDDEDAFAAQVGEVVRVVAEETGWAAFDPQTDAAFDPTDLHTGPGMDAVHQIQAEGAAAGGAAVSGATAGAAIGHGSERRRYGVADTPTVQGHPAAAQQRRARMFLVIGVLVTLGALALWAFDGFSVLIALALALGVVDIAIGLMAWREARSHPDPPDA